MKKSLYLCNIKKYDMMNRKIYIFGALLALLVLTACQGGKTTAGEAEEGDTLKMK